MMEDFKMEKIQLEPWYWTRAPQQFETGTDSLTLHTDPETDLWQRTYYGMRADNAPVYQTRTDERFFTFTFMVSFDYKGSYDQCGVAIYLDSENWMKASIEYENPSISRLGSVVTNHGYSDWATTDVSSEIRALWFRLSRRESDYYIETSRDGVRFEQMRVFHLREGGEKISFGVYAASPADSRFTARFTQMQVGPCTWQLHG